MSSVDEFQREMQALGREPEAPTTYRRRSTSRPRDASGGSTVQERTEGR
jgi:hypothetical protein